MKLVLFIVFGLLELAQCVSSRVKTTYYGSTCDTPLFVTYFYFDGSDSCDGCQTDPRSNTATSVLCGPEFDLEEIAEFTTQYITNRTNIWTMIYYNGTSCDDSLVTHVILGFCEGAGSTWYSTSCNDQGKPGTISHSGQYCTGATNGIVDTSDVSTDCVADPLTGGMRRNVCLNFQPPSSPTSSPSFMPHMPGMNPVAQTSQESGSALFTPTILLIASLIYLIS
eukprot:TRINITY_DN5634_c0_g1_i1.p1 TRINITY_DN5634_c0_g1~~TRINITY_DN5634_c0_g1_i1.p1  ORF type:complete len:224 (-),score=4.28 TRINITY_DN5634_c0_g1_i1:42-713(-)